jgi:hypothetical protein
VIARPHAVLTVVDVALVRRDRRFTSLGLSQSRRIAGSNAIFAVGNVALVFGYSQRNRLLFRELRMVAGIEAVSAMETALAVAMSVRRLATGSTWAIAALSASLTGSDVLHEIGRLCKKRR